MSQQNYTSVREWVSQHEFKQRVLTAANASMKLNCPEWDLETVDMKVSNHSLDGTKVAITMIFKENGLGF